MPRKRTPKTHCIRGHARTAGNIDSSGSCIECVELRRAMVKAGAGWRDVELAGLCECSHSPKKHDPADGTRCYAIVKGGEYCACERLNVPVPLPRMAKAS